MLDTFRATCRKPLPTAANGGVTPDRCDKEFTDPGELKAHLIEVHGVRPPRIGNPFPYRAKPTPTRPAVRPDKQRVTPGEWFTHKGVRCQVIGHTGPANVAFLAWITGEDWPENKSAELISTDPDGVRMFRMVAPTSKVVEALANG